MSAIRLAVLAAGLAVRGLAPVTDDHEAGPCVLEGVVQAESVRTVQVTVTHEDPEAGPLRVVSTDADGGFEVTLPGPGRFRVSAAAPGLLPEQAIVRCDEGPVELALLPGQAPMEVGVRSEDNQAVEGAYLVLSRVTKVDVDPDAVVLAVPPDGIDFALDRGTTYRIAVSASGYGSDATELVAEDADTLVTDFFLPRLHTISGVVRNAVGEPVPRAVVVRAPSDRQPAPTLGRADDTGTFRLVTDPHEPCTLVAHTDDGMARLEVEGDRTEPVVLVLVPGASIDGLLRDDQEQRIEGTVRWRHSETGLLGEARTRADGAFHIGGLPPGPVEIWASGGAYDPVLVDGPSGPVVVHAHPLPAPISAQKPE